MQKTLESLHLVRLKGYPIYQQLLLEEALLRTDKRNWCLINEKAPPSIVLGISSKPNQWVNQKTWTKNPIPIIRRFSGGGTVVIDENTHFFTLICNQTSVPIPHNPNQVLCWNAELYRPLLSPYHFTAKENDYALSEKKFGGNAQYFTKNRWLHHSTLLWDYDPEKMQYLSTPPRMPNYRKNRSHEEFLCCLKEVLPSPQTLTDSLLKQLSQHFEILEHQEEELLSFNFPSHRKSTKQVSVFQMKKN